MSVLQSSTRSSNSYLVYAVIMFHFSHRENYSPHDQLIWQSCSIKVVIVVCLCFGLVVPAAVSAVLVESELRLCESLSRVEAARDSQL